MVKIRLKRMGAHKKPFYRVVVADSRTPRNGKFIEEIGTYDPLKSPSEIIIDNEAAKRWLANGAQPTEVRRYRIRRRGMGSLVEVIAKALVTKPDEVLVTEETDGRDIIIRLKVADEDIGKIIGKSGRIAKAIRTVVKAAAIKQNLRVSVEIVEED